MEKQISSITSKEGRCLKMKKCMDKIQFESRYEIDEVVKALDTFLKEHPNSEERETIKKLSNLLDVMYMEW